MRRNLVFVFLQIALLISIQAAEVTVAVASNFSLPMRKIVAQFEAESDHKAVSYTHLTLPTILRV